MIVEFLKKEAFFFALSKIENIFVAGSLLKQANNKFISIE